MRLMAVLREVAGQVGRSDGQSSGSLLDRTAPWLPHCGVKRITPKMPYRRRRCLLLEA